MNPLKNFYGKNYKAYLAIPILILVITAFLAFVYPGVPKGIDLSGGTLILIRSEKVLDAKQTEEILLSNFDLTDLSVVSTSSPLGGNGLTIRFARNELIASAEAELSLAKATIETSPSESLQHSANVIEMLSGQANAPALSTEVEKAAEQASEMIVDC